MQKEGVQIERIIEQEVVLTPEHNQTNIPIAFQLESAHDKLVMMFEYGPSHATEAESFAAVREALQDYYPLDEEVSKEAVRKYVPIENLVTVSLSYNGEYLGARHTKERVQKIVISENGASLGFPPHAIRPGQWEMQLNAHCIASAKVTAKVGVFVERVHENEPVRSGTA